MLAIGVRVDHEDVGPDVIGRSRRQWPGPTRSKPLARAFARQAQATMAAQAARAIDTDGQSRPAQGLLTSPVHFLQLRRPTCGRPRPQKCHNMFVRKVALAHGLLSCKGVIFQETNGLKNRLRSDGIRDSGCPEGCAFIGAQSRCHHQGAPGRSDAQLNGPQ